MTQPADQPGLANLAGSTFVAGGLGKHSADDLDRILAGRNVEVDAVEAFLDPTIKRAMPDPNVLTAMPEAAGRIADAARPEELHLRIAEGLHEVMCRLADLRLGLLHHQHVAHRAVEPGAAIGGARPSALVEARQHHHIGADQPGLEQAEFVRLGSLHRNTFIKSPVLLDETLRLKAEPRIRFAGQITGCEGYVESAAVGLFAGRAAAAEVAGRTLTPPPPTTALGALLTHITGGARADSFQPMNVNFGLFPPIDGVGTGRKAKGDRKAGLAARAVADMGDWLAAAAG